MRVRTLLSLALLISTSAMAASSGFLLGVDYSEWLTPDVLSFFPVSKIATDSAGALYVASIHYDASAPPYYGATVLTKLSADGKTILWQNNLGFEAQMAVDPNGGVYVLPAILPGDTSLYVAKLTADGAGIAWKTPAGAFLSTASEPTMAADSQGRTYVAGVRDSTTDDGGVVRLNAAGTAVDYTAPVSGTPSAIAVDETGAAYVAGSVRAQSGGENYLVGFLARLAPDGSAGYYSAGPLGSLGVAVAVDLSGNAAALYSTGDGNPGILQRFDLTGAVTFTLSVPGVYAPGLALDAAGNAYVSEYSNAMYPVRNSLATCGSSLLSVFSPDGSLLQSTYVPGTGSASPIAMGPNSSVFVAGVSDGSFAPTRTAPFPAGQAGESFLWHLSPNANAQTFLLACLGNAATFDPTKAIAPGELVTLFGNGLGPQQGVQTSATLQNPFPTQEAGVTVTFDGTPAPLLWVQDAQINAVAPWSLTPGQNTQVCVSYNSVTTNCLTWPVAQTAPGVFTVDGTYAAAINQNGTVNSANHPAPVGSVVAVWATGLGPITPAQGDGTIVNLPLPTNLVLPVGVQAPTPIFEPCHPGFQTCPAPYIDFDVTYAGPAPYMVAGVSQINFQVVDYASAGYQTGAISVTLPSTGSQGFQIHYVAGQ